MRRSSTRTVAHGPRAGAVLAILLGTLVCLGAGSARADGMRCGDKIVSEGDTTYQVRTVCGTPDATIQRTELRTFRRWVNGPCVPVAGQVRCGYMEEHTIPVSIEEWTYDLGPHALVRFVIFEQGKLLTVKTGGYGVKQT